MLRKLDNKSELSVVSPTMVTTYENNAITQSEEVNLNYHEELLLPKNIKDELAFSQIAPLEFDCTSADTNVSKHKMPIDMKIYDFPLEMATQTEEKVGSESGQSERANFCNIICKLKL